MNEFVTFITKYWRVLIVLVFQLVTFVILLFKKKVRIDDIFKQVLMLIPDFINIAESKFSNGAEKYSYVFNRCVEMLCNLTHKSGQEIIDEYTNMIDSAIENVLSTPQKK